MMPLVVDFMLNDDGVVALEFDAFSFLHLCEILNSHTARHVANHISWDVAGLQKTAFPVAKSRVRTRPGDNLWIVRLDFLRLHTGFFGGLPSASSELGTETAIMEHEISNCGAAGQLLHGG